MNEDVGAFADELPMDGEATSASTCKAARIVRGANGAPRVSLDNAVELWRCDEEVAGSVVFDEFNVDMLKMRRLPWTLPSDNDAETFGPWSDRDSFLCAAWFARKHNLPISAKTALELVASVSKDQKIDPLRDYFASCSKSWDGTQRLATFGSRYFGTPDDEYSREVTRRWMIAAAARALFPGCKVDNMLILRGSQGGGKSRAAKALCGRPEWFFDGDLALGDKDGRLALGGRHIVEVAELASANKATTHVLKQFLTNDIDIFRPPYGRRFVSVPRRSIFIGTVNDDEFLRDNTGARRFWPVSVGTIDVDAIIRDRDQLWGEAALLALDKVPHWVNTPELRALCEDEAEEHRTRDAWEELATNWLAAPDGGRQKFAELGYLTTGIVLDKAFPMDAAKRQRGDEMRIADVLRACGWEKHKRERIGARRVVPWKPKATAEGAPPQNGGTSMATHTPAPAPTEQQLPFSTDD